jgi:prevent-host-death family protein
MRTVGAYEAKVHFGELLTEVENGATIVVTRHGAPVAKIVPCRNEFAGAAAAIDEWERYRDERNVTLDGGITIRDLIEEGRE